MWNKHHWYYSYCKYYYTAALVSIFICPADPPSRVVALFGGELVDLAAQWESQNCRLRSTVFDGNPLPAPLARDMAIVPGLDVFRAHYGCCEGCFLFHIGMALGGFEASRGSGVGTSVVLGRVLS